MSATESVMEGDGFYNRHSAAHKAINAKTSGFFVAATAAAPLNADGSFVIADYGAAQGANSLQPIGAAVPGLRARGVRHVLVYHVDLRSNDFSALFRELETSALRYAAPDIYRFAVGRSFYEQVLPDDHLSAGWCASSVHWLSSPPPALSTHLWVHGADAASLAAWDERAAADYATFLGHRLRELRVGGQLVLCAGVRDPKSGFVGPDRLLDLLASTARDMVGDGILRPQECDRFTLPCVFRARASFEQPLLHGLNLDGRVLEIAEVEEIHVPTPLLDRWREDGDASAYARDTAASLRAWSGAILRSQLDADRSPQQAAVVIDTLFTRLAFPLEKNPDGFEPRWTQLVLRFVRTR